MATENTFAETLPERLAETAQTLADRIDGQQIPDRETSVRLIRSLFKSRRDGGSVVWSLLSRPRKNATDDEKAFRAHFDFHSGRNVNLHGVMNAQFLIRDPQHRDNVDTLASLVYLALTGKFSRGAREWSRALHGR